MQSFEIGITNHDLVRQFFGQPSKRKIYLYEDCGGGLHLHQEGRSRVIGNLLPSGSFADDAKSLAEGGVVDWNGQTAYMPAELESAVSASTNATVRIAEYNPETGRVTVEPEQLGSAGREFLGYARE